MIDLVGTVRQVSAVSAPALAVVVVYEPELGTTLLVILRIIQVSPVR